MVLTGNHQIMARVNLGWINDHQLAHHSGWFLSACASPISKGAIRSRKAWKKVVDQGSMSLINTGGLKTYSIPKNRFFLSKKNQSSGHCMLAKQFIEHLWTIHLNYIKTMNYTFKLYKISELFELHKSYAYELYIWSI